jgi:hypothetical protein
VPARENFLTADLDGSQGRRDVAAPTLDVAGSRLLPALTRER